MSAKLPNPLPFWPTCRVYFRRLRLAVWLAIFAVVAAAVYVDQEGLPGFLARRLVQKLSARGVDARFSRIRLRFYEGIVADNVRFGQAGGPFSVQMTASQSTVLLNPKALLRLQFQIDAITIRQGRLVLPIVETNRPERQVTVDNIQAQLRFLPEDQWALDDLTAEFAGAKLRFRGSVTHASAIRQWKLFHAGEAAPAGVWADRIRRFADLTDRIRFAAPPQLQLNVRGDALDPDDFEVRLTISAPGADTPWGSVSQGKCEALLYPMVSNQLSHAELRIKAASARTPWASAGDFQLTITRANLAGLTNLVTADGRLTAAYATTEWASTTNLQLAVHVVPAAETNLVHADVALSASKAVTKWGGATNASFTGSWIGALTNPVPLSGQGRFHCEQAASVWGRGLGLEIGGSFTSAPPAGVPGTPSADPPPSGWWTNLNSCTLDLDLRLASYESSKIQARSVAGACQWRPPALDVSRFHATVFDGALDVSGNMNTASRTLQLHVASEVDPHRVRPLVSKSLDSLLADFSWAATPVLTADAGLVLPTQTNRPPDWSADIEPSLWVRAEASLDRGGAFRGFKFNSAHTHVTCSNRVWELPDLTLNRPEGGVAASLRADARTQNFHSVVHSTMDVTALRPLLSTNAMKVFDLFVFTKPPLLDAEVWGRGSDPALLGVKGHAALTNFTFRGETGSSFTSTLQYTNRVLRFTGARLLRGISDDLRVDALAVDFSRDKAYMTNGAGTGDPMVVARAIGPQVARVLEPYQFARPPRVRVGGVIPLRGSDADLYFDVQGGPFHWSWFNLAQIDGSIHWLDQSLTLTNVHADFYGGKAAGRAAFDFTPGPQPDFNFNFSADGADMHWLMSDLRQKTNHVEGRLGGTLDISHANTGDWRKTQGRGNLNLRDALIWDIPMFGIFSEILNGISPGAGSSRAGAADGTFAITNGIIRSDDLTIRTPTMRLDYRGTVDLQGSNINARVEAGLFRDTKVIGLLVSKMFWPVTKVFEYKITGSLAKPKTEPAYLIPKVLLMPFHPIRTLEGLVPEKPAPQDTNVSPATNAPPPTAVPGKPTAPSTNAPPAKPQ